MHFALPFCSVSANVVALDDVLDAYDSRFRLAVHRALLEEGFELGMGLPNLQLAQEIREAIGWFLENEGFDQDWSSMKLFLEWAEHQGILVDLSPAPGHWPATA
jgi:hypothetical protein